MPCAWANAVRAGAITFDSGRRSRRCRSARRSASANAAAMPRPSAIARAAITGTLAASTACGTSANVPGLGNTVGQEHAAVAARLRAFRDDDVGAVFLQPDGFLVDGR